MRCYHSEGVRCENECFTYFSYCKEHFDKYLSCPFTYKHNDKYIICKDTISIGSHFCKKHLLYLKQAKERTRKIKFNYHIHKTVFCLNRTKEVIFKELYRRTNYYLVNGIFPGTKHSIWMLYLLNQLER